MAGKNRVEYQIGFIADTSNLKAALNQAMQSLQKLGTAPNLQLTSQLKEASAAALDLSNHLRNAYNQDTGKLDLVNFNNSLKQSNMTLQQYADKLISIGPAGERAFLNVAQAISKAELPLKRTSKLFDDLWLTMKNTMRWQLTSSVMHGFMGAINTAYGYTKDLNRSLNSIQIVTNKNTESMEKFAKSANKAAKELSTTTVDYTDASLIYYQQGLSDQEVEGRANTTIKLANVARESAEEASEQMTAIWNNFYDGSKSLEYYADVMTALGASTASSTQEISAGLQKFAAIANSVGLSYEYATSALATITATTRESADIVGTSLRTLFARIQGLMQDQEQDDGTTLNKYSKALHNVGIEIKDVTTGELKGMNQILDEMGEKWGTLTKAEQMALAQTVAGVRQYTQLIALMENWQFFQENLVTAMGAEGSLEKQAQIYAKSWEAARDRVRAATEDIYDSLINEQTFIDLDNIFTPILTTTANIIDALGGMQGILATTSILINKVYGEKIAQSIRDMGINIGIMTGKESERARILQKNTVEIIENLESSYAASDAESAKLALLKQEVQLQGDINAKYDELDSYQKQLILDEQDKLSIIKRQHEATLTQMQTLQESSTLSQEAIYFDIGVDKWQDKLKEEIAQWNSNHSKGYQIDLKIKTSSNLDTVYNSIIQKLSQLSDKKAVLNSISAQFQKLSSDSKNYEKNLKDLLSSYNSNMDTSKMTTQQMENYLKGLGTQAVNTSKEIRELGQLLVLMGADDKVVQRYVAEIQQLSEKINRTKEEQKLLNEKVKEFQNLLYNPPKKNDLADYLVTAGTALGQLTIAIQAFKNLGQIFNNDDMTTGEQIITILTSLSMLLPVVNSALKALNTTKQINILTTNGQVTQSVKVISSLAAEKVARRINKEAVDAETALVVANTIAKQANLLVFAGIVLSVAAAAGTIFLLVKAYNADADAAKKATEQQQKLKESLSEIKNEYNDLITTIESYDKAVEALKDLDETTDDYIITLKKANEQAEKLLENNKELQSIASRNDQGLIVFDEQGLQQYEKLQQQRLASAQVSEYYGEIAANDADIKAQRTNILRQIQAINTKTISDSNTLEYYRLDEQQLNKIIDIINTKGGLTEDDLKGIDNIPNELIPEIRNNISGLKNLASATESSTKANEFLANEIATTFARNNPAFQGETNEQTQAILRVLEFITKGESFQKTVDKYLTMDMDTVRREYAQSRGFSLDYKTHFGGTTTYYDKVTGEEIPRISDEIAKNVIAQQKAQEEVYKSLENSLQPTIQEFEKLGNSFGELGNIFLSFVGGNADNFNINAFSQKQVDVLKSLDKQDLSKFTNWNTIGYESADSFLEAFTLELEKYDPSEHIIQITKFASSGEKSARALIEEIQSGKVDYSNIFDNENYNNLIVQLNKIKDDYPEIDAAFLELSKNWEVGTQKFSEALEDIQNRLANIKLKGLIQDAEELSNSLENLNVDSNIDEFQNTLSKLIDKNYEIDIEIHTQAEQEFDSIVNGIKDIEDKASMIGEGFIVAADDIRELNNTFPGIIKNLEYVGDGTIKLNEEIVNSAINVAKQEIAADAEATIAKLKNQAETLRAKQIVYKAMADAARILAEGETKTADASADAQEIISAGLSELKQLNSNAATEIEIDNNKDVADSAQINAGAMVQSYEEAYKEIVRLSAAAANAQIANLKATEPEQVVPELNYQANYIGASGQSGEERQLKDAQTLLDATRNNGLDEQIQAEWARIAELWDNLADSVGANANDIEGMIAGIGGQVGKVGDLLSKTGEKASNSNKKNLEELKELEDRYHEINREIERQSDLLDDINNDLDRTFGVDKFKNFSKELTALTKQQENYQAKLKEAQERYLPQDMAKLQQLFDKVIIKSNGEIGNYEELLQDIVDEHNSFLTSYNNFITSYNAMTKAEQEANATALEAWEARKESVNDLFKERQDALKQYEDTRDTIQEIRDALEDTARQIADNKLSQVEYKLEVILDVKSMKDAIRDFDKQVNEIFNDALTHGIPVANLSRDQAQAEAALYPEYKQQYQDLLDLYENSDQYMNREQIIKDIQDLQGKVLDSAEAIVEWVNGIEDIIPAAIDAARERYNLFIDQLEHNNTVLDTIKELYALQGVTYKTMEGFNQLQKVSQERLEAQLAQSQLQRAWYDEARIRFEEAEAKLESLGGDETDLRYDTYKKERDALLAEMNEAEEAYLSFAKEAMETAQEMYEEQLEKAVYDFGQIVSKGIGLDLLQDKYDHYIESNERYFDKVNEAYQTTAWFNKLQQDIDKATNQATKDRLLALQQEINIRRENNRLSQYDLDILNAKYEVLQAQMALEDAQNAKNQLKLVRDSQGNWNYQYIADPTEIENAQQNLIDKQIDWYNIAKEQVTNVTGEIISTWQECQDQIKQIYSDMTLTDQERADKAAEIYNYYTEKIKYLEEEKQISIADMTEAGNANLFTTAVIMGDELTDLTGMTAEDIKNLVEQGGESVIGLLTKDNETIKNIIASNTDLIDLFDNVYANDLNNMTNTSDNFEAALRETLDKAQDDYEKFREKIQQVGEQTGTTLDDLNIRTDEVADSTDRLRDAGLDAAQSLWQMVDASINATQGYLDLAQSIWESVEAMRALAQEQANYVDYRSTHGMDFDEESEDLSDILYGDRNNNYDIGVGVGTGNNTLGSSTVKNPDMGLPKGIIYDDADGSSVKAYWNPNKESFEEFDRRIRKMTPWPSQIQYFKTGGYTGEFSDAKLAFLHEKELVLNKEDTANLLETVGITRDIFSTIEKVLDGNGVAAMALMASKLGATQVASAQESIEQTIHIDNVSFPNITSSDGLEEAFVSLANDALQWVHIKKK